MRIVFLIGVLVFFSLSLKGDDFSSLHWIKEEGLRLREGGVPYVMRFEDGYRMYYCKAGGIFSAFSYDGLNFFSEEGRRIDRGCDPSIVKLKDGVYRMYYKVEVNAGVHIIHSAISYDGINWKEEGLRFANYYEPCYGFCSVPDAVKTKDGRVRIYFVCNKDKNFTASIISSDGLNFKLEEGVRLERAVDPNVITLPGGGFLMFYATAPSYKKLIPPSQIWWAYSKEGINWRVLGKVADEENSPYFMAVDPSAVILPSGRIRVYYGRGGPGIVSVILKEKVVAGLN